MTKEILPETDLGNTKDCQAIRRLELMDEVIKAKRDIEGHMKDGFLMLSKARYIMGPNSVSMLQIPHEDCDIEATCHIYASKDTSNHSKSYKFEISELNPTQISDSSVRNRKVNSQDVPSKRVLNTINWFSALPPQSLRQAQQSFKLTLQRIAEVASIQSELNSLENDPHIPIDKLQIS